MDAVRRHLGGKFELAADRYDFLWIDEFPLFDFDAEEKKTSGNAPSFFYAI